MTLEGNRHSATFQNKAVRVELPTKKGEPISIIGVSGIEQGIVAEDPTGGEQFYPSPSYLMDGLARDKEKERVQKARIESERILKTIIEKDAEAIRAVAPVVGHLFENEGSENSELFPKLAKEAQNTRFYSEGDSLNDTIQKAVAYLAKRGLDPNAIAEKVFDYTNSQQKKDLPEDIYQAHIQDLAGEIERYSTDLPPSQITPEK